MDVLAAIHAQRGKAPGPRAGSDESMVRTGYLVTAPDAAYLCAVSVNGSEPISGVPATPATYTGVTTVRVLMQHGRPVQVLGPAGSIPATGGPGALPPPPGTSTSTVARASRVILPQDSGTYRVTRSAWRQWGDGRDVYQNGSAESGQLWGLAAYGDQFVALGASSILSVTLSLVQMGTTGLSGTWVATVRGSASGTLPAGAPAYTGSTVTVSLPGRGYDDAVRTVDLDATMCDGLRTGALKSLGLTGSPYGITKGAGRHGQAWACAVDYEVTT